MDAAYLEGWEAFRSGREPWQNPYRDGTIGHAAWLCGWEAAKLEVLG